MALRFYQERYVKVFCRMVGARCHMSLLASCVYYQLLKYANDEGKIFYRGGDFVRFLGFTYGATAGDRRVLPGLLDELERVGAITRGEGVVTLPQYLGHRPRRGRFVADGTDLSHETFRLLYCAEKGSYATLSFLARGMLGELLALTEDDGRLTYMGDLGGFVASRRGESGPRRRLVRKLIEELEGDGIFVRDSEGAKTWVYFRNFAKANPAAARELEEETGQRLVLIRGKRSPDVHEPSTNGARAGTENADKPAESLGTGVAVPARKPGQTGDLFGRQRIPYPAWFLRIWEVYPPTNGRKPKMPHALRAARRILRQRGWEGDQLADRVLASLAWQNRTTDFLEGKAPHLVTYLNGEGWEEPRPTDPLAFVDPSVPPRERLKVAQQQRVRRRQDERVRQETSGPDEDPREVEARRLVDIEKHAFAETDWKDQGTWRKPYRTGLDPAAQEIWDRVILQRLKEMRKEGVKVSDLQPGGRTPIKWARQFIDQHHPRQPSVGAAVPDQPPGIKSAAEAEVNLLTWEGLLESEARPVPILAEIRGRRVALGLVRPQAEGKVASS